MKSTTVTFEFEKTTKNTAKFNEMPKDGQAAIIGSLYVQRWFAGASVGPGTKVQVKLDIQEGGAEKFE